MFKRFILLTFLVLVYKPSLKAQVYYPSETSIGNASGNFNARASEFRLENNVLVFKLFIKNKKIEKAVFTDKETSKSIELTKDKLLNLELKNNSFLNADNFKVISTNTSIENSSPDSRSLRAIDQLGGKQFSLQLSNNSKSITIGLVISLHDSCNFIQQQFQFQESQPLISKLQLVNIPAQYHPAEPGVVDGLPLIVGNMFFGIEHPMAFTDSSFTGKTDNQMVAVAQKDDNGFSTVIVLGVTPKDQLRRGFLYYTEKVRAVPYRPYLHYNSWFDLSYDGLHLHEADCIDRVQTYIDSLVIARNVKMKAFLWDDGWDDPTTLWHFNKDMPNGFTKLEAIAKPHGINMGVWVSPWGGYDVAKEERLKTSRNITPPLGINEHGFSLADKNYFNFFTNITENFVKNQGVSIFKFDGVGSGNNAAGATEEYQGDVEGLLRVILELRKTRSDLYCSLTVGTWPSPYWLKYGDNIWRSGDDVGKTGTGNPREQWINYRDQQVYRNIVLRSELYPLNALMDHGICIADNGEPKSFNKDFQSVSDGIWSFFGNGISLQELYIDPHKLTTPMWNELARAIHWSHSHQGILSDVHWVGGNPDSDIYGYGAWNPSGGTLMLRNPTNERKTFVFTLKEVLELPEKFNGQYFLQEVISNRGEGSYNSNKKIHFVLNPHQVVVLDINKQE